MQSIAHAAVLPRQQQTQQQTNATAKTFFMTRSVNADPVGWSN